VGPPAPGRESKGVHKVDKQLQWPQLSEQALAGVSGPLTSGSLGGGKKAINCITSSSSNLLMMAQ